ncbi:CDP-diacylglycerol--glycerol-3-phosphate 3-phosphatidyltransferase [Chloroflexus sp.]|uniref:CDP-diacylglycerol--glycerol-3-phosphate 3-phosphatidyltransferase n=1 Tax=Chloroflexus sp. TaxID=1904827 RepID=UPI002ACD301F|nr:CDP-diacylglycerol--glycerol-3-phosphate 3-phosphatidyltransferase [Chloroflexus sp.]
MRQLPNLLGLFRIIATPILAWLVLVATPTAYLGAAFLLLLMALSDMADGRLARHLKVVSPLGIFIDTISDKIFVAGVLIPMIEVGLLPAWVALTIIVREFVVSGLRSFAAAEGVVISARRFGKQKLVITVVALIWLLLAAHAETGGFLGMFAGGLLIPLLNLWPIPMSLALIWTIGSGIEYLWQAWPLLRRSWSPRPSER